MDFPLTVVQILLEAREQSTDGGNAAFPRQEDGADRHAHSVAYPRVRGARFIVAIMQQLYSAKSIKNGGFLRVSRGYPGFVPQRISPCDPSLIDIVP